MKRLHPLVGLVRALRYGVSGISIPFFLIVVAGNVFTGLDVLSAVVPAAGIGLVVGVVYGVVSYTRFTYRVTEGTFDVFSGVLGRRERELPHGRIQNVDITRNVWQKTFGLATVRIETAGGGRTEAVLDFVSVAEAERLERTLREKREAARNEADTTTDDTAGEEAGRSVDTTTRAPEQLFALSAKELAVHAATTFRPGVIALLVIGTPILENFVVDLLVTLAAPLGGPERLAASALTPDAVLALAVVTVPLGFASAWAIGVAIGINQYYGFRLGQRGEELVYDRGLLSEFSGTIPLGKVQTLTVTENPLQRALGYAGLSIDTAGYAGGGGRDGGNRSAIPIADRTRVVALVGLLEGAELDATFTQPPKRARERYVVRYTLALAAVVGIAFAASQMLPEFSLWWTPALLAPAIPVIAHLKWTHRGYALGEDHLLVRSGFLRRRTQIVPYRRLQTITRSRTVFQRRRHLAHLIADTASGGVLNRVHPVAYDQPEEDVWELQGELRQRLQTSLRR